MISRRTIVNLITFFALAGILISYGFFSLIHNPLAHERTISTVLPDTGGLKPGFTVTMRGVPIGAVGSIRLQHDGTGVRVKVVLQPGTTVPNDVAARVQRANPLGEQQLDLVPLHGGSAPPLADGASIPSAPEPVPPAIGDVVDAANRLFDTIPTQDLGTLIHQSALALAGRSQDLRTIVDSIDTFSQNLLRYQDQIRALLANSPPVLDTVAAVGPQLRQALANTVVLTDILAKRRADLVQLFDNSAALGSVGTDLLDSEGANLSCLVHALADTAVNVATAPNLANLDATLLENQQFFGPIDAITPSGPLKSLGPGSPTRSNQTWDRVRTLLPPQQPPGIEYSKHRTLPPTKPGGACLSVLGPGVGPASQTNPAPPGPGGSVIPAPPPTRVGSAGSVHAAALSGAIPAGRPASAGHPETLLFVLLAFGAGGALLFANARRMAAAWGRARRWWA